MIVPEGLMGVFAKEAGVVKVKNAIDATTQLCLK
jgi:hypothetical protein